MERPRIVELDQDHPGFRDKAYRDRRDSIAAIALGYAGDGAVPLADYSDEEHRVWASVWEKLSPAHEAWATEEYLRNLERIDLRRDEVDQLRSVNHRLADLTGFQLVPIGGLGAPEDFLRLLADKRFLATQYIRHHSAPFYTPEPDIIHEVVGHSPMLADQTWVDIHVAFGRAATIADDVTELLNVYWWSIEFGLVRENGGLKAYGAGLLSSFGELARIPEVTDLRPFDIEAMGKTNFDPTAYQDTLFVADSVDEVQSELRSYLDAKMTTVR